MRLTYENITFHVSENTDLAEITSVVNAIQEHDKVTQFHVQWNPRNHYMVPAGHIHVTPTHPDGSTLEAFIADIHRYFNRKR